MELKSNNPSGEVIILDKDELLRHERQILKQSVLISSEEELLQGPLDGVPLKHVEAPDFTGEKIRDELGLTYLMIRHDLQGEKRISPEGRLQDGRKWLFNTFKFGGDGAKGNCWFVTVNDLMKALQYDGDDESFIKNNTQLVPLEADEFQRSFLKERQLIPQDSVRIKFFATKSVFVQFGAAVILGGLRVLDDYWESLAREENLTPHHRVFKFNGKILSILKRLKPSLFLESRSDNSDEENSDSHGELPQIPFPTITEQASADIRYEYGRQFAEGQHSGEAVPGQSINGSLELSNHFKLPKYHSKNSFQQAAQLNALDAEIGCSRKNPMNHANISHRPSIISNMDTSSSSGTSTSTKSGGKRLLSNIMDTSLPSAKGKKSEEQELISAGSGFVPTNVQLNVNSWKFETLPLCTQGNEPPFSIRGLPYYKKDEILERLKKLSPNQVKELEHVHDSVILNKGLQSIRKIRSKKWGRYWQYKAGSPLGAVEQNAERLRDKYLRDILKQRTLSTIYNDDTLVDEIQITSRVPNANFLNNSNIKGFKPPYAHFIRKERKK